jgi:uncharacterized protein (DUF2336 family)
MSAAQAAFIPELEQALRHVAVDRCPITVGRVADFFSAGAGAFNAQHVQLFDRVLCRLMVGLEDRALAALSRHLAPIRNAPPEVMRRLAANSDIAVAAPVLARSRQLEDHDLIAIVQTQSQAHLLAISGRSGVSEAVTDALVECGDRDVARNLALNRGARFSETGLTALIARAAIEPVLAEKLAQRHDVAPHRLRGLMLASTVDVRDRLMAIARDDARDEVAAIVDEVSRETADASEEADAWRTVRTLQRRRELDEAQVLDFARRGRTKHAIAALAVICDVSVDVVRRLMQGDQPEAALVLCQAAGFGWEAARAIVAATGAPAAQPGLDQAVVAFERLSPATAAHMVGFWNAAAGPLRSAPLQAAA